MEEPQTQCEQLLPKVTPAHGEIASTAEATLSPVRNNNKDKDNDNRDSIFRTPTRAAMPQSRQAQWWQSSVVRRSSSAVDEAVDELTEKSQFLLRKSPRTPRTSSSTCSSGSDNLQRLDSHQEGETEDEDVAEEEILTVAPLHREEIQVGQLLGEGTFSCVYEVIGFNVHNTVDEHDGDNAAQRLRHELASAPLGRFALKHLKADLLTNTKDFEDAATDLVMEAKYLGALNHPNILKLRGQPVGGAAAFANRNGGPGHYHDGYFLLTDRLTETLAERIEKWKTDDASNTNTIVFKTRYALQIADALAYVHEQRIIFRDLKPSNIGFNPEDQIQLFDFGLCRELPPPRRARPYKFRSYVVAEEGQDDDDEYSASMDESWNDDEDDLYATTDATTPLREEVYFMSGAGTQIYMAPEILLQNRYNLKADVYSWAMTVTEMILLEKPLPWYPMEDHIQYICKEGDRPCLEDGVIPDSLRDLLAWAWEGDVSERCTMAQAREELRSIIRNIEEDEVNQRHPSLPARLVQAVSRIQEFFRTIYGRTLLRFRNLFDRGSQAPQRRDVTFDLPTATNTEPASENLANSENSHHRNSSSTTFHSFSAASDDCLSPASAPKAPGSNYQYHNSQASRAAMLKRKPSSASTTAMTDDECDDDMMVGDSFAFSCKPSPGEDGEDGRTGGGHPIGVA